MYLNPLFTFVGYISIALNLNQNLRVPEIHKRQNTYCRDLKATDRS